MTEDPVTNIPHETKDEFIAYTHLGEEHRGDILDPLLPFMETIDADDRDLTNTEAEQIQIELGPEGDISLATTKKLPNLRFRIKDLLLEGMPQTVVAGSGMLEALDKPVLLPFLALNFLRFVQDLSTLELNPLDAKVLLELYRFRYKERTIDRDVLNSYMEDKIDPSALAASLEHLDELGCISLLDGEIVVNEVILIRRNG
jgi:hypothetical protein